ncbi:nuclear transport factor 2 family protein [Rhizorhabdus wittichii]|uniref:Nuclear transport factor 2 family protein n=1 Tax=Rhizorhabdus wittichii TaxID=160791 RepID=A0A975CZM7_9SPHN|nr:nuclear transport factor 2 family protein [Rhizorhabdus wittichii]QTH20169.1 nuclear transport factor 2 family protein [Rhizorhabdus wittichii]
MANKNTLESAFAGLVDALDRGDLERFFGTILADAVIMDEDLPFRVDRAGFETHIAFHASGTWENFTWKPGEVRFRALGDVGSVTGFAMFRGKPRDAGYRLRPMMFTQGWIGSSAGWRIASWHQSPIVGHVNRPSPA